MNRARRHIAGVASALLLLAVGACSTPASEETSPGDPATTVTADPGGRVGEADVTTTTRPSSPLAEQVRPLGPAVYDPAEHVPRSRVPVRLQIPGIGVDGAPIRPVGVEPDGEMEIPPAAEVGWYRYGAAPGEPGSAVLAAHIAYDGVDGAFRYLDRLDVGDEVVVGFDDGTGSAYVVTELRTYPKTELPTDVFSRDTPERLVLITCGGDFNPSLRSYDSNVVAYAVPAADA